MDDLIARLARQIDAVKKAERFTLSADDIAGLRRRGACELHAICADFVSTVNGKLSQASLELEPPVYTAEMFREVGPNLIQVASMGRLMQIAFQSVPKLVSTDKFLTPYTLEGEVRTYNQRMLERLEVQSLLIFFCIEEDHARWRYFDWRLPRTGAVDRDLLAGLMGRLF